MRTFARLLQTVVVGALVMVAGHSLAAVPAAGDAHLPLPWVTRGPDGVQASGAALADGITGTVLWSRELNTSLPMASITKVMTALVVINAGGLDRAVTVPQGVVGYCGEHDGSTAGLAPGEVLTARHLLYALLLPSGCDAAYALAEAYGPGQQGFLAAMNDTARRMGMAGTYFADPSGLPNPTDHSTYSTPAALVTLGLRAMSQPVFREIVGSRSYQVPAGPGNRAHFWETTNGMLGDYPGTVGIKTGNTDAAGTCLLFETVRAGIPMIGVVLHSSDDSADVAQQDAERMLNWAYNPILAALPIG